MHIWVDADACPLAVKNILYKAANRTQTMVILVSNQHLQTPASVFIKKIRVPSGFDIADNKIIELMEAGDLVITADIPLANSVIEKGGMALNPRGELYSTNTIKQRLSIRDFNEQLRNSGIKTSTVPKLHAREIQAFANSLDKLLLLQKKNN